jgi:hypothetical protein
VERHLLLDLGFLIGLLLLGAAGVHGLLRRRRRWLAGLAGALLIGPPLWTVVATGYRYAGGSARLTWPTEKPRYRELHNLDPHYRVFVQPQWSEQLWQRWSAELQQHTRVGLIQRFGPMRGSYLGLYPEREQVRSRLLELHYRTAPSALAGPVAMGDREIRVPEAFVKRALADADRDELGAGGPKLDLALLEPDCLVVGYWSHRAYHAELLDLSGFGWFAHYVFFEDDGVLPGPG